MYKDILKVLISKNFAQHVEDWLRTKDIIRNSEKHTQELSISISLTPRGYYKASIEKVIDDTKLIHIVTYTVDKYDFKNCYNGYTDETHEEFHMFCISLLRKEKIDLIVYK
jgi:hypothetical protein